MKTLMRLLSIILLSIFGICNSFSQSYIKMIDNANVWDVLCGGITTNGVDLRQTDKLQFMEDTIINDTIYHKLYSHTYITSTVSSLDYKAALREDTIQKKIYRRNDYGDSTETLLYDFSLSTGDSTVFSQFLNNAKLPIKIDSISTINFGGQNRRLFYVKEYYQTGTIWYPYGCQWIEGIGKINNFGKIIGPIDDFEWMVDELLCFWHSDQLLYQNTNYLSCIIIHVGIEEIEGTVNTKIYPNPIKGELTIEMIPASMDMEITISNIIGQEIFRFISHESSTKIDITGLPGGIYILKVANKGSISINKIVKE